MNRYKITVGGEKLNEYIQGRISGIIYVLTGMPDFSHAWYRPENGDCEYTIFECTEEQFQTIVEVIDKWYGSFIECQIEQLNKEES